MWIHGTYLRHRIVWYQGKRWEVVKGHIGGATPFTLVVPDASIDAWRRAPSGSQYVLAGTCSRYRNEI